MDGLGAGGDGNREIRVGEQVERTLEETTGTGGHRRGEVET